MSKTCDCKHINGIRCEVENCEYNREGCYCTAEQVHVGPSCASCSSDTVCDTFKPER